MCSWAHQTTRRAAALCPALRLFALSFAAGMSQNSMSHWNSAAGVVTCRLLPQQQPQAPTLPMQGLDDRGLTVDCVSQKVAPQDIVPAIGRRRLRTGGVEVEESSASQ